MIKDLAIILIIAGVVALIFKRLRQPVVLGYIVAGFLVSANMPYTPTIEDYGHSVEEWANIGVMFLMFCLGLEFSVRKILKQGIAPVKTALVIIFSMMLLGFGVGKAFGWSSMNCIFLGGMLAMSSTTIIYKAFDDLNVQQQSFASMVMSVLILEDIFGIIMMVILQTVSSPAATDGGSIWMSLLTVTLFIVGTFGIGLALIPMLLRSVRRFITSEILLIIALGLCCLSAYISLLLELSIALGAFLIGSVLAETSEVERINKVVEPVKNLFGAIFFVSVGMLVDPEILIKYWAPILTLVLTIIIGQSVFGSIGFFIGGQKVDGAIKCGFSMTQIGEFSFIIATLGLSLGVIDKFLYPVVVAVSVITTFTTPYMMKASIPVSKFIVKAFHLNQKEEEQKVETEEATTKKRIGAKILEKLYLKAKINAGSLPQNADRVMNSDIHISEMSLPEDSLWVGKSLKELQLGSTYNVHISSILRGSHRINVPNADERLLPEDRLQVVGSDENLAQFSQALQDNVYEHNIDKPEDDMILIKRVIKKDGVFHNKSLRELNLRKNYAAMLVGMEIDGKKQSHIDPDYCFQEGDIVWIVCESKKRKLM